MAGQIGKDVRVAYKVESTFNTDPGASGATRVRFNPSPGLSLARAQILPGEVRSDGQTPLGRMGSRNVAGSFIGDLSVFTWDGLLEAGMRGTWADAVVLDESDFTSITTTTSTIVAASGSWITLGVRIGDVIRITNHATAANNNRNLRVTAVTATTITVAETLTLNASADSDCEVTILRKLVNGATPVRRSFHFEQYFQTIDQSQLFGGCRIGGPTFRGGPDGMATIEFPIVGASMAVLATGSSPHFTDPVLTATKGLTFVDARIRFGGETIVVATNAELATNLPLSNLPVIGSTYSPDVFDEQLAGSGSLSILREDLSRVEAFDAETPFSLEILLEEQSAAPGTAPRCFAIYVPSILLSSVEAPLGGDGGMIETVQFTVGKSEGVTAQDDTMFVFHTDTPA